MTLDGKTPAEMSREELEAAAVYCTTKRNEAQQVADLNALFLVELAL